MEFLCTSVHFFLILFLVDTILSVYSTLEKKHLNFLKFEEIISVMYKIVQWFSF